MVLPSLGFPQGSSLSLKIGSVVVTLVSPTTQEVGGGCSGWVWGGSARCHHFRYFSLHIVCVLAQLEQGNFFSSTITKHSFFPSVHDAVVHISKERRQASVSIQPCCPLAVPSMAMERATTPTPPCLPLLGGPQHQNVAPQEEHISPRSRVGKEGFATLMAPTHPPWGLEALIPTSPSGLCTLGPCPIHEPCCDGAAAGRSCCWLSCRGATWCPHFAPAQACPTGPGCGLESGGGAKRVPLPAAGWHHE